MDSFELNKIIGAILATCILVLVTSFAANALFAPHNPEKPGFEIAVTEEGNGAAGAAAAKKCAACHTFDKGGPNRVGPNLFGTINEKKGAGKGGFNFSAAMKAKGGDWTF